MALEGVVEELIGKLANNRQVQGNSEERKRKPTFSISEIKRRKVIAEKLRVCIVTFAIPTATAHVSASPWPVGSLLALTSLNVVPVVAVKPLLQVLHP